MINNCHEQKEPQRVGLSILSQDHDKMVREHLFLQAGMRKEMLQLESMSSNKPLNLIPLQVEVWRNMLRELMCQRECPQ
ncbi:unnamed protein product [Leuciscus chuanchicus]